MFSSRRKHLLVTLLSLEFIVLGVYLLFYINENVEIFFYSMVYLTFTACEGALGLTLILGISQSHGTDYFIGINLRIYVKISLWDICFNISFK